jgi:hypothetical protein
MGAFGKPAKNKESLTFGKAVNKALKKLSRSQ